MVKQTVKHKKPSRHHVLLVSVFAIIIFLAVIAFVLQRNTYLGAVAGEAVRQTKQLALTEDQIKVKLAVQAGKETEFFPCPERLEPALEQHWKLEAGWEFTNLPNVVAYCFNNRITCYYGADKEVITAKDLPGVEHCKSNTPQYPHGCDCDLK